METLLDSPGNENDGVSTFINVRLWQGDSITTWRTEAFRLFKGGSLWLPPQPQQFTAGMPDEVFEKVKKETDNDYPSKGDSSSVANSSSSSNSKRGRLSQRYRKNV